jgi:hypothetical protein
MTQFFFMLTTLLLVASGYSFERKTQDTEIKFRKEGTSPKVICDLLATFKKLLK